MSTQNSLSGKNFLQEIKKKKIRHSHWKETKRICNQPTYSERMVKEVRSFSKETSLKKDSDDKRGNLGTSERKKEQYKEKVKTQAKPMQFSV